MPTFPQGFGTAPFFGDGGLSQARYSRDPVGEKSMDPATIAVLAKFGLPAAAKIGSSILNFITGRGQISQAQKDRDEQRRQFLEMLDLSEKRRLEDLARQQEALDFYRGVHEADWRSTTEREMPNIAASRAILGSTMQTDVPAYRPRYSEAEGVEREENPYGPYIYRPRSA